MEEEDPKKRLKWWHNTIGYVGLDKMMKAVGRPRRCKKSNTISYALFGNV